MQEVFAVEKPRNASRWSRRQLIKTKRRSLSKSLSKRKFNIMLYRDINWSIYNHILQNLCMINLLVGKYNVARKGISRSTCQSNDSTNHTKQIVFPALVLHPEKLYKAGANKWFCIHGKGFNPFWKKYDSGTHSSKDEQLYSFYNEVWMHVY